MARQDPIKKNRYWFKFPEEWSNRNYKDKVLGIRRMYLLEHYFDIRFDLIITLEDPPPELAEPAPRAFTFYILNCFVDRGESLQHVCDYFDRLIKKYMDRFGIAPESNIPDAIADIQTNYCDMWYYDDSGDSNRRKCSIIWSPIIGNMGDVAVESKYCFFNPNSDAEEFFGRDIFTHDGEEIKWHRTIRALGIWDRQPLYILSSIATSSDQNSYLGHTRTVDYIPIKYYRIDSDDKEFWVEFYSTRDHTVAVDNLTRWSDFHIEAIFMYSTAAML
jgi:hypothetical protein